MYVNECPCDPKINTICCFMTCHIMIPNKRWRLNANMLFLQVVSHGEQVFPRVKERCASKSWFASEDITALEDLIGRLRRLKENLGFITNRVTTLQASLDSWQSEQINKSLYYLSFLSIVFLPLSIVTGGKFSMLVIIVDFPIIRLFPVHG